MPPTNGVRWDLVSALLTDLCRTQALLAISEACCTVYHSGTIQDPSQLETSCAGVEEHPALNKWLHSEHSMLTGRLHRIASYLGV